jgi:hypothetical protein
MYLKSDEIKIHRWLPIEITETEEALTAAVHDTSGRLICTVRGSRLFVAEQLQNMGIQFAFQERPELFNGRSVSAVNRTAPRE